MIPKNKQQKSLLEEFLLGYAIWLETNYPSSPLADCKSLDTPKESVPDEQPNEQIRYEFATVNDAVRAVYGEAPDNQPI